MKSKHEHFLENLVTGFVDKTQVSSGEYQPELLVNQKIPPKKVLSSLIAELNSCSEFYISVAFATTSGVATIINHLQDLKERGVKGKILVSQYLNFTQPEALSRLLQFDNIQLRIAESGNVHSKGFIFKSGDEYNIIVGSSNLTAPALTTNLEWNLKFSALKDSNIVENILREFESNFYSGTEVTEKYIADYSEIYSKQQLFQKRGWNKENYLETEAEAEPNSMQEEALENLKVVRKKGKNKALIISATGTGKTFLSAFDAREFDAKKLLFVVHRLTIAKDALQTFQKVFNGSISLGIFSGFQKELECDFLFSTVQTISKPENLELFHKNYFDYIIIDESHRSGAASYLRLIDYFSPKFLLGMTATPERTDGSDIFEIFDHNIAYEIRLSRAMEEDLLSSFHYYGVSDLSIDNNEIENKSDFNYLASEERVNQIIKNSQFYGTDNGITRGLIFCSRTSEAIELSNKLNSKGFKTVALTGDSSEEERKRRIDELESNDLAKKLDYILTVDIFNEGIDIPKINQIIMLRPTESAIIFIQQIGRGLRKADGKGYLTVIDFIGNYDRNYLIPIALYGDTTYNKDTLRKLISEGSKEIPGTSTINFDKISKEKIFQSIDSANMRLMSDLKNDYQLLKYKLGKIPMMMDFIHHGARDPFLFVEHSNSYLNFVAKVDKSFVPSISLQQRKLLELFAKEINNSKRVEESIMLEIIVEKQKLTVDNLRSHILTKYGYQVSQSTILSCATNLKFEFIREKQNGKLVPTKEVHNLDILTLKDNEFILSSSFVEHLKNEQFRNFLIDNIRYSIYEFDKHFDSDKWNNGFVLYRKYSRKDVFRILNAEENPVAQNVGGYLVSPNKENCPIFVNYHKEEHISESTKYEDEFINAREFSWMSKSNRTTSSKDVRAILGMEGPIRLPLFIKKNNDEGTDFYYMGDINPNLKHVEKTEIKSDSGKLLPIVKIRFDMDVPVTRPMMDYLNEDHQPKERKISSSQPIQQTLEFETSESVNRIPLYNFYAAAGTFSELQSEKNFNFIHVSSNKTAEQGYFACKVFGESMNRVIPNGSICLFKKYEGGTRNGKIVLVENHDIQDPDFNSAFTVKTYSSEKIKTESGWEHSAIILRPNSFDSSYKPIHINEEDAIGMRVVGEFIEVIKT